MIARNFIAYPEALAHQLCLDFGAVLRWATARPGSRILRTIRATRARAAKQHATVPAWVPPVTIEPSASLPAWALEKARAERRLAGTIRAACCALLTEEKGRILRPGQRGMGRWGVVGFSYA